MKKILFVHDLVFGVDGDGVIFGGAGLDERYFERFFCTENVEVNILSRFKKVAGCKSNGFKNKKISVLEAVGETYIGFLNPIFYIKLMVCISRSSIVVISTPSVTGSVVALFCNIFSKPYTVEVAGDVDAFLSKKGGWIFSIYLRFMMPFYIKKARGAAYVTNYLSSKFPNRNKILVSSNVNIEDTYPKPMLAKALLDKKNIKVGFIGGLTKRKGLEFLIRAARQLIHEKGYVNISFHLVGGHSDFDIENLICECDVEDYFFLHGLLPKKEVLGLLDGFDLYVQPSLSEGLPRATIEAMSFGLPVVATRLPGFEEILDKNDLVECGNVASLSQAIENLILSDDLWNKCSARNLQVSTEFLYEKLHKKRFDFYSSFIRG